MPRGVSVARKAVVEGFLHNPYNGDAPARAEVEEAAAALKPVPALAGLLREGRRRVAEELVLSLATRDALQGTHKSQILDEDSVPARLFEQLPRDRLAYIRVALAAARARAAIDALVGDSDRMLRVRREIWAASFGRSLWHALALERVMRDDDVLILGETGTGKELVAGALQEATPGNEKGDSAPRGAINAAALPETLIESELFGYVKGAFTGANDNRTGRIRSAHLGCFFLDEVGDLPLGTQVKLLRVLESDEVSPLGSDQAHIVDVRFVAATHKDLRGMVEAGEFRRDFYQRLAGLVIELPALRERAEDIPAIGAGYVRKYVGEEEDLREEIERVERWLRSPAARRYAWPGNVRELQNVIRTVLIGLTPDLDAPEDVAGEGMPEILAEGAASLRDVGDWYIRRTVERCGQNLAQASRILGVDRSTIRRRLKAANEA